MNSQLKLENQILTGPAGLRVQLNFDQVIPAEPAAGDPIIVRLGREISSSWYSARMEGWRLDCGTVDLEPEQVRWLESIEDSVDGWLARATAAKNKGVA